MANETENAIAPDIQPAEKPLFIDHPTPPNIFPIFLATFSYDFPVRLVPFVCLIVIVVVDVVVIVVAAIYEVLDCPDGREKGGGGGKAEPAAVATMRICI